VDPRRRGLVAQHETRMRRIGRRSDGPAVEPHRQADRGEKGNRHDRATKAGMAGLFGCRKTGGRHHGLNGGAGAGRRQEPAQSWLAGWLRCASDGWNTLDTKKRKKGQSPTSATKRRRSTSPDEDSLGTAAQDGTGGILSGYSKQSPFSARCAMFPSRHRVGSLFFIAFFVSKDVGVVPGATRPARNEPIVDLSTLDQTCLPRACCTRADTGRALNRSGMTPRPRTGTV